jgi:hypothetical protein
MSEHNNNDQGEPGVSRDELRALMDQVAQLTAQLAHSQGTTRPANRHPTPSPNESAFGGTSFQPLGQAALPGFKPYGADQTARNPAYSEKARESRSDPGTFTGNKDQFDKWVVKLEGKLRRDNKTYEIERDRMDVVFNLLDESPAELVEARYSSTEIPFSSTAEIIATLAAVYHDDNQASRARAALKDMMYDPGDKEMDIHQFIGKINSLADKANVHKDERKSILQEHVPAYLGNELLTKSKDPDISYEAFCTLVGDAALNQQRAYEERRNRKASKKFLPAPVEQRPRRRLREKEQELWREPRAASAPPKPADRQKDDGKETRECFICRQPGHLARKCPERRNVANLLRQLEEEDSAAGSEASEDSDTSSSESEN